MTPSTHLEKLVLEKTNQGEKGTKSEKNIQLNEGIIREELGEMVRQSVEDTLNTLPEEEPTD